jgi:hypothetical protein
MALALLILHVGAGVQAILHDPSGIVCSAQRMKMLIIQAKRKFTQIGIP